MAQRKSSGLFDLLVTYQDGTYGLLNYYGELVAWDLDYFQAVAILKDWENELCS